MRSFLMILCLLTVGSAHAGGTVVTETAINPTGIDHTLKNVNDMGSADIIDKDVQIVAPKIVREDLFACKKGEDSKTCKAGAYSPQASVLKIVTNFSSDSVVFNITADLAQKRGYSLKELKTLVLDPGTILTIYTTGNVYFSLPDVQDFTIETRPRPTAGPGIATF